MNLRKTLFWDTDVKTISLNRNARYIIERVLEFGNDREVRWLTKEYGRRKIRNAVLASRSLDRKSRALWLLLTEKKTGK
ncbi:MAG: hypothetical protein WCJ29_01690 [bacterium]